MVDFVVVVALIHEGEALGKGVGVDTPGDGAVHEDLPHGEHVHRQEGKVGEVAVVLGDQYLLEIAELFLVVLFRSWWGTIKLSNCGI